jgi:hypothetical protein
MTKNISIVAIHPSHAAAEAAITELQQGGFDMTKLSIVGRDYYNAGDQKPFREGGIHETK